MQKKLLSLLVCAGLSSIAHATVTDKMIENDFEWAANERARILEEWQRRYATKTEAGG